MTVLINVLNIMQLN